MLAAARRRRFRRQEVLFHAGDPGEALHLIAKGRVAVYVTTPLGSTATFAVLGPGEAVGELALVSPVAERTATAIALEPTETLSLRRDQFEALRNAHPFVDRLLVELLAARVRQLDADLVEAFFTAAETRVLRRLARLATQYADAGGRAVIHLTQEDLAGLADVAGHCESDVTECPGSRHPGPSAGEHRAPRPRRPPAPRAVAGPERSASVVAVTFRASWP